MTRAACRRWLPAIWMIALGSLPAAAQPLGPNENPMARCLCACIVEGARPAEGQLREIVQLRLPRGDPAACAEHEGTLCPGRIYAVTLS